MTAEETRVVAEGQLTSTRRILPALESRKKAVNAVITGGAAAGIGIGFTVASAFAVFGPVSPLVMLGGTFVGGTGLFYAARAGRHLLRFGSPGSAVGFLSAGALGLLGATWPILTGIGAAGLWQAPMWLRQFLGATTLGLSLFVLFYVLRIVVHWVIGGEGENIDHPDSA